MFMLCLMTFVGAYIGGKFILLRIVHEYSCLMSWGKRNKMRCLPSILSLFRNEFIKFNNTGARMLDSIYHMKLKGVSALRDYHGPH